MAQLLRLSSPRRIIFTPRSPLSPMTTSLLTCRACQHFQKHFTSCRTSSGFKILYRRASSMKVAQKVMEPLKRPANFTTSGTRTELCKLLQARIIQLRGPCSDVAKAQLPKGQGSAENWLHRLQSFKQQMRNQREKHALVPEVAPPLKQPTSKRNQLENSALVPEVGAPTKEAPLPAKQTTAKRNQRKRTKAGTSGTAEVSPAVGTSPPGKDAMTRSKKSKKSAKRSVHTEGSLKRKKVESLVGEPDSVKRSAVPSSFDPDGELVHRPNDDFEAAEEGDVEAEEKVDFDVVKEMKAVLEEKQTAGAVVRRLEKHLQGLIDSTKLNPESLRTPFWKPESLKNMAEVKGGLEVVEQLSRKMSQLQLAAVKREVALLAARRNAAYNQELCAYIDVCLHAGLLRKAHGAIIAKEMNKKSAYHSKKESPEFAITDVEIYNKVMGAWAKQGDIERIQRLFKQMLSTGIKPTLQSYATILECLGRTDPLPTVAAKQVLDDITASDCDLGDILETCYFEKDEWEYVNKAILSVRPDFVVRMRLTPEQYSCSLLSDLNSESPQLCVSNPHSGLMPEVQLRHHAAQQMEHERADFISVKSILPANDHIPKVQAARKCLEEARAGWRQCLRRSFKHDIVMEEKRKHNMTSLSTVPYLKLFPHNTYVNLMMQEIDTIALETESYSPSLSLLQRQFGARVNRHFMAKDRIKSGYINKLSGAYLEYLQDYVSAHRRQATDRQCWQELVDQHTGGVQIDTRSKLWPSATTRMVGRWLYRLILMDIKIDANLFKDTDERKEIPAFYPVYRQEGPVVKEVIKPHPLLVRLYRTAQVQSLTFDTSAMPSLTPPLPWTSVNSGGNLLSTTNLVINPQRSGKQLSKLQALQRTQLNPVFDTLNVLSATPWRINCPVLDIISDIFNAGGNLSLSIPQPASSFPDPPKIILSMSDEEKVAVLQQRAKIKKAQQEMHSLWMTELYCLSIANHYRNDIFWFPHNLDFRSRVYAIPPHFNHLGRDLARSILLFAEGRKLGPDGFNWLKIHLINLTGLRKRHSNVERLQYADEIFDEIVDSADYPMTGRGWWMTSDEPWQTLACCREIVQASRCPNPEEYVCHYPVHQDGSCNGLQHYAALGRDQAGAKSVNLHPFDSPKDVYSDIVDMVEKERQKDAKAGEDIAIALQGFIQRKVIKQTIMTTVYGVTRFGARLQIEGQLQDLPDFPKRIIFDASLYLTRKTFDCLQMMFTSTKEIQDWFTVCAKLASSIHYKPMEWETPLGWPVLQPYYRTFNPAALLKLPKAPNIEITNKNRQKNGFPPNFIHSLDSSHMMLTAVRCQRAGIAFVSVHDCFWTHAAHVAVMNKICREEFVALHKEPILENLASFMYDKYGYKPGEEEGIDPIARDFINHVLQRVPNRGTFDLDLVLDSTYFFS